MKEKIKQDSSSEIEMLHKIIARTESENQLLQHKLNIEEQKNRFPVAVVVHVFYLDVLKEICDYLNNIKQIFDLFVSSPEELVPACSAYIKTRFPEHTVYVKAFENVGRDVYPFLFFYNNYLFKYDLVLKVHTKKSTHASAYALWRKHLLENLVGSEEIVLDIMNRFKNDSSLGLVFPEHYPLIEPYLGFEKNYFYIKTYLLKLGIVIAEHKQLNFPSGTFFWFRPRAFVDLLRLNDLFEDFASIASASNDMREGLLEHAFERIFHFIVKNKGFKQEQVLFNTEVGIEAQLEIIKNNNLVDEYYYLNTYKDVKEIGISPSEHYFFWGADEGRSPFPGFDTQFYAKYLKAEPFIKRICPVVHWFIVGKARNYCRNEQEEILKQQFQ